ncbi:hypothetical protein PQX77_020998 [Marasmius sp. AFHP31]|nr:hypothetical protein PQX77_020998 [Marasmius sp. AFHP31]
MASDGITYLFNNQKGSKSYNNTGNGSQTWNWYRGKVFNQNSGPGQIVYNYGTHNHSDNDDDNEDRPLSAEELQKELRIYRRRPKLNDDDLEKLDGQDYLNFWQRLIISDLADEILPPDDKTEILDAMIRLSDISGLSPKCLRIQDVDIEILEDVSDPHSKDVEVSKGRVGTLDVIVKALKKGPRSEQLKALLRDAVIWRKLHHHNVLSFLGLYYLDESRSRVCVVYPWMEQDSLNESLPGESEEADANSINEYAEGVIEGLDYIHGQNVTHGGLRNVS